MALPTSPLALIPPARSHVPAACCGIFGLEDHFGLVSLDGVYPDFLPATWTPSDQWAETWQSLVQGMDLLQRGFAGKFQIGGVAKAEWHGDQVGRLLS